MRGVSVETRYQGNASKVEPLGEALGEGFEHSGSIHGAPTFPGGEPRGAPLQLQQLRQRRLPFF
jgi:hypothetical protein